MALVSERVPVRSLSAAARQQAPAEARTCYDHLAGRVGVELRAALLVSGRLEPVGERDHVLTEDGRRLLAELRIDHASVLRSRRVLARDCLDWTERQPHLAGALPAALLRRFCELGWFVKRRLDRGLVVTAAGRLGLDELVAPFEREDAANSS